MAASLLRQVFCCCCGPRSHSPGDDREADENTRLIRPQTDEEEPSPSGYVVNHQVLKDRLGIIVRAKESKMVNVSTELPFNLAHKVMHGHLGGNGDVESSASSSRSRSALPVLSTASGFGARRTASFSPPPRRDPSPSIPTSRSNSSLHPGDASYLPPEADPHSVRGPTLNARLVRRPGTSGFGIGIAGTGALRQGRSVTRGRTGRFEGPGTAASVLHEGNGNGNGNSAGEDMAAAAPEELEVRVEDLGGAEAGETVNAHADVDLLAQQQYTQPQAVPPQKDAALDFGRIQDVGKLTCSWGD